MACVLDERSKINVGIKVRRGGGGEVKKVKWKTSEKYVTRMLENLKKSSQSADMMRSVSFVFSSVAPVTIDPLHIRLEAWRPGVTRIFS